MVRGWGVFEYDLYFLATGVWAVEEIVPCCNDTVQFLGYILKCITLSSEKKRGKKRADHFYIVRW